MPSFQTLAEGFRLNLLQRIYKRELQPAKYPSSHLPGILDQLLRRGGRPTLETHVQRLGPLEWEKTAIALKQHNKMFSAAFSAGQEILILSQSDRWESLSNYAIDKARIVAKERGYDWNTMTEEEKEEFIDEIVHEPS